ncbi:unnamed protein product [Clavelina lepadiformis]|uniref:Inositol polyphosphate-related phosphatase domain-containing protein n=1 Tax=Clavelina lepadiformis TaxID=159417 RepID=A0ABP0EX81_CLALP
MKEVKVRLCTWNVGNTDPVVDDDIVKLLKLDSTECADIYMVGLQEIKVDFGDTASRILNFASETYDDWAEVLLNILSKRDYFLIENVKVQAISLSVFAHISHLPFIHFIRTDVERTGIGRVWGNKGGVAISANIYNENVCFLNTHLAAHRDKDHERMEDVLEIFKEINFKRRATIQSHDLVLWLGDMNWRIEKFSKEEVVSMIVKKEYDKLLHKDQLMKHMKHKGVISEFCEAAITFPPSYKFDVDSDLYDTSEKQRVPAWTDRILYRVSPHSRTMRSAFARMLHLFSIKPHDSVPQSDIQIIKGSYTSLMDFQNSDHKPVVAECIITLPRNDNSCLVDIEILGSWVAKSKGEFQVTYRKHMQPKDKDYLALYQTPFTEYRAYKAWMDVPKMKTKPNKAGELTQSCKFSTSKIKETGKYRVGYYSNKMSCLLALSDPFEISTIDN